MKCCGQTIAHAAGDGVRIAAAETGHAFLRAVAVPPGKRVAIAVDIGPGSAHAAVGRTEPAAGADIAVIAAFHIPSTAFVGYAAALRGQWPCGRILCCPKRSRAERNARGRSAPARRNGTEE